ncbi:MAG: IS1595 family transposase [Fimbriimonadaceae bacterium]
MDLPRSLTEACVYFADPERAERFVALLRWPDGACCPDCGAVEPKYLATRRLWKCNACKRQFSVKVGTIFEASPLPLGKWLVAVWLHANSKNGVSSCELARAIKVSQKTAWHMAHRIRLAMESRTFMRLSGQVEADETYIGGKHDPRRKSHPKNGNEWYKSKQAVLGFYERGSGSVRAYGIPDAKAETLSAQVYGNVWPGTEPYTDNAQQYVRLRTAYIHKSVSHSTGQWAIGDVHTNGIENFWCLLKRSIRGTWIRPSPKHITRFVTDQVFRYNFRHEDDYRRFEAVVKRVTGRRLTWKELVDGPG